MSQQILEMLARTNVQLERISYEKAILAKLEEINAKISFLSLDNSTEINSVASQLKSELDGLKTQIEKGQ